jgi:hypothetical protein
MVGCLALPKTVKLVEFEKRTYCHQIALWLKDGNNLLVPVKVISEAMY